MNSKFNIVIGFLSLFAVFFIITDYKKTGCVTPWSIDPFCGPQFFYPMVALSSFFTFFGLHSFYLAWKKHRQEQEKKRDAGKEMRM